MEFIKTCLFFKPKDTVVNLDEGPATESEWYAVTNGRHGVWDIFKSSEEASEFVLRWEV